MCHGQFATYRLTRACFVHVLHTIEVAHPVFLVLNELSPVRQLPGASTRARVEEIEKSADRHIGYECYE